MRSWMTRERVDDHVITALNVVLPTKGCSWNKCHMCSYALDSEDTDFLPEFIALMDQDFQKIKIFTSGSFLDTRELPELTRNKILDIVKKKKVRELTIETRPEFAEEACLIQDYLKEDNITLEVAIGLESSNDRILKYCINKGFTFKDFVKAVTALEGMKTKAYLLIKPPFLTEYEAIEDAVKSAEDVADMVDVISFNPVAIHKKTLVEYLWRTGNYSPPWMWSVVEVLNRTYHLPAHIVCHPVAVGKRRGIKNCRQCTGTLARKIQDYSLSNKEITHDCQCRSEWLKEVNTI
ncbi:MAG: archaeosine biosynthesis radical SAM protein RaSEA [Candidatus Methanofastidiosia archaeon]